MFYPDPTFLQQRTEARSPSPTETGDMTGAALSPTVR